MERGGIDAGLGTERGKRGDTRSDGAEDGPGKRVDRKLGGHDPLPGDHEQPGRRGELAREKGLDPLAAGPLTHQVREATGDQERVERVDGAQAAEHGNLVRIEWSQVDLAGRPTVEGPTVFREGVHHRQIASNDDDQDRHSTKVAIPRLLKRALGVGGPVDEVGELIHDQDGGPDHQPGEGRKRGIPRGEDNAIEFVVRIKSGLPDQVGEFRDLGRGGSALGGREEQSWDLLVSGEFFDESRLSDLPTPTNTDSSSVGEGGVPYAFV